MTDQPQNSSGAPSGDALLKEGTAPKSTETTADTFDGMRIGPAQSAVEETSIQREGVLAFARADEIQVSLGKVDPKENPLLSAAINVIGEIARESIEGGLKDLVGADSGGKSLIETFLPNTARIVRETQGDLAEGSRGIFSLAS